MVESSQLYAFIADTVHCYHIAAHGIMCDATFCNAV